MTGDRRIVGEDTLDELALAIGEPAARALAETFGGTRLYVPKAIGDHHPLCVAIGRAAADVLAGWAGSSTILIPKTAARRARVLELARKGALTRAQIARETGYSERHVYQLLREEDDARQPPVLAAAFHAAPHVGSSRPSAALTASTPLRSPHYLLVPASGSAPARLRL